MDAPVRDLGKTIYQGRYISPPLTTREHSDLKSGFPVTTLTAAEVQWGSLLQERGVLGAGDDGATASERRDGFRSGNGVA